MRVFFFLILCLPLSLFAQFTESRSEDIRTMRMVLNGVWDAPVIAQLGSDDRISFSFDEMSHSYNRYTYKVVHCNEDWTPSELFVSDYLSGFNVQAIENVEYSQNTTQLYTNYSFTIPNENISVKASGNYKVEVYSDDEDEPVAIFGFAVVEHKVRIGVKASGNTDIDFNDAHQQLELIVDYSGYDVRLPVEELKVRVMQNNRIDNIVECGPPTYLTANRVEYSHKSELIFAAGNEYRKFEITDPYVPSIGVESIEYADEVFNVYLYADECGVSYRNEQDENGRYYINTLEGYGNDIEADYALVHFCLNVPYREGGDFYLLGDYWGNAFTESNVLYYDDEAGAYLSSQLMKFGVYNYQYVWLPRGLDKVQIFPVEGSFYNTGNEYLVLVYQRAFGERYDRLIGALSVKTNN